MTIPTGHLERLAEREESLASARAALRTDREQIAADRAEAARLLAEARDYHRDAARERERAGKLARRFVRRLKQRHAAAQAELREARARFAADHARLIDLRSEFHTAAAASRDRLRDAWAAVEAQLRRSAADGAESERYLAEQMARLDARAADLASRERTAADRFARCEAETIGLREEAAALEARVANSRAALAELEARRDCARAELLGAEPPPELAALATGGSGNLADREAELARATAAAATLRESLEREIAGLDDRKRVAAEELTLLSAARAKWQAAERRTVFEMEEMARDLRHREADLDLREERLLRADSRRRDEAYDLWQVRLRLESWQTKLTVVELKWHTEREQTEADLDRRRSATVRREVELADLFARWEKSREDERNRLRAELEVWRADRERLAQAAAEFELRRQLHEAEISTCAARAMAAEELAAATVPDGRSDRGRRRLAVLRKRWERLFDRKVKEIDAARTAAAAELAALSDRYRRLHVLMEGVFAREAAVNNSVAAAELHAIAETAPGSTVTAGAPAELAALRNEVERVAGILLEMGMPEPLEVPDQELPWGAEEPETEALVFQFDSAARAA